MDQIRLMRQTLPAVLLMMSVAPLHVVATQQSTQTAPLTFEVASVRRNPSVDPSGTRIGPQPGGRFIMTNGPVWSLITLAYDVDYNAGIGNAPDWLRSERYDVTAKAPEGTSPSFEQIRLMVQSLLKERFRLVVHEEIQEQKAYALRVAPTGSRLLPAVTDCGARRALIESGSAPPPIAVPRDGSVAPCQLRAKGDVIASGGTTMAGLARTLTGLVGEPVVDRTDLSGYYAFDIRFAAPRLSDPSAGDPSPLPSLFTVLEEELGLRLLSERVGVPVLVIDSVDRPSPD